MFWLNVKLNNCVNCTHYVKYKMAAGFVDFVTLCVMCCSLSIMCIQMSCYCMPYAIAILPLVFNLRLIMLTLSFCGVSYKSTYPYVSWSDVDFIDCWFKCTRCSYFVKI